MNIVPFYAAMLALLFVLLSVRTLRLRRSLKVALGDAGNPVLLRAMRVHSNFAEYVPLGLLLIFFVESGGASTWLVHVLGLCLLAGRCSHAFGVSQIHEDLKFRVFGMAMTFACLIVSSVHLLYFSAVRALA